MSLDSEIDREIENLEYRYSTKFSEAEIEECKNKRTSMGFSLHHGFITGKGLLPSDAEAYSLFHTLFEPVIKDYHEGFGPNTKQPKPDFGENKLNLFKNLDPGGDLIISTRIRCARSLEGYPFNVCLTKENYMAIEAKAKQAFELLQSDADLRGTYFSLEGMAAKTQNELIASHLLFKCGASIAKQDFWPTGRGIYMNQSKTFLVWVNEEDHLRIISMQAGGNVGQVFERLIRGIKAIEKKLTFSRDDRLGWLTFCPSNLGTTIRASVHIQLPKIGGSSSFREVCLKRKIEARGLDGEHSESFTGVYDLSNSIRLGLTEFEAVKQMYDGVKELTNLEKGRKLQ